MPVHCFAVFKAQALEWTVGLARGIRWECCPGFDASWSLVGKWYVSSLLLFGSIVLLAVCRHLHGGPFLDKYSLKPLLLLDWSYHASCGEDGFDCFNRELKSMLQHRRQYIEDCQRDKRCRRDKHFPFAGLQGEHRGMAGAHHAPRFPYVGVGGSPSSSLSSARSSANSGGAGPPPTFSDISTSAPPPPTPSPLPIGGVLGYQYCRWTECYCY